MSTARARIVAVLDDHVDRCLTPDLVDRLADQLMPTVVDTVARGYENAAVEIDKLDLPDAADYLHQWASDARFNNSFELPELPDDVEPLGVVVLVSKGEVIDEDEAVRLAVEAVRRAVRSRNAATPLEV